MSSHQRAALTKELCKSGLSVTNALLRRNAVFILQRGTRHRRYQTNYSKEERMNTSRMVAVVCMTGSLVAFAGLPADAQHSSGGTSPSVTENQGQTGSKGTQGVPGSGWNAQKGGSGSGSQMGSGSGMGSGSRSGEANSPESSKGTGYGLESGSHSERDLGSGQMRSGGTSGSGGMGSGGSGSGGIGGGR